MKSLEITVEAPVIFTYTYAIDEDEIHGDSFEEHIGNEIFHNKDYIADMVYQYYKEDLHYYIAKNLCIKGVKIKAHSKNEFDF